ncbi:unnamed protein product [Rhizoctonia solani]|uniref:Uncharacterized protein n=1 Tax=Rhizoctonia solani TaxID=456999 RepID=A0A8H3BE61_9AGAM|nr:unnamed protein product [Rhizoctonia solani]
MKPAHHYIYVLPPPPSRGLGDSPERSATPRITHPLLCLLFFFHPYLEFFDPLWVGSVRYEEFQNTWKDECGIADTSQRNNPLLTTTNTKYGQHTSNPSVNALFVITKHPQCEDVYLAARAFCLAANRALSSARSLSLADVVPVDFSSAEVLFPGVSSNEEEGFSARGEGEGEMDSES